MSICCDRKDYITNIAQKRGLTVVSKEPIGSHFEVILNSIQMFTFSCTDNSKGCPELHSLESSLYIPVDFSNTDTSEEFFKHYNLEKQYFPHYRVYKDIIDDCKYCENTRQCTDKSCSVDKNIKCSLGCNYCGPHSPEFAIKLKFVK